MCTGEYFKIPYVTGEELSQDFSSMGIINTDGKIAERKRTHSVTGEFNIVILAKDYIRDNFAQKINVGDIAKKVFVSRFHFSRIFKRHCRQSPYQYLTLMRLKHAKSLMCRQELSITEITFQSGFSSVEYFSAAFKKKYQVGPSIYRKMLF